MKKIMKGLISLGLGLGLIGFGNKVNATTEGFVGIPKETVLEAGQNFSTVKNVKYYENGQERAYSVYLYKSSTGYKKVSSKHYINTKVANPKSTYMLKYTNAKGSVVKYRKVIVRDTKAPEFKGISDKTINQYSKFSTIKGISAYDLSSEGKKGYSVYLWKNGQYKKVSSKWYINTKHVGKYQLKYVVKDRKGNTNIKYRKITVKAVAQKTASKPSNNIKITNTVNINVKAYDERGWWHENWGNTVYHHSYAGEALSNIKVGTKININGIPYVAYDKFTVWAPYPLYSGSSYSKQGHYTSRGGKNAENYMANAPIRLKTCYDNGYSKDLVVLAKPLTNREFKMGGSSISVSAPQ
ncbi:DUF5011 domain-containing protein [Enterococcus casseliflavus]|nr:DUF5011 domain-containing protein [Enterococcus casseliflavus]